MGVFKYLLCMVLVACGHVVAEPPAPATTPGNVVEAPAPAFNEEAILVITGSYEANLGIEMPEVVIHWTEDTLPDGASGLHYDCGNIWINICERCTTKAPYVMSHEIGHCAHRVFDGDSDGDHSDPAFWYPDGWVDQAHIAVRAAGL